MASENFITRSYTYTYDGLNRLTDAIYRHSANNAAKYHEKVTYEKNGNILDLQRWGYVGSNTYNIIDQLVYSYKPNSNQLMKVIDMASPSLGFADGTNQGDDYDYYTSGNLKKDLNKGIGKTPDEEIRYNYMNLPTSVIKDTDHHIEFVYTAAGNKIEKKVTDGAGNIKTISYAGRFIYENNSLQYFSHPEGYVEKETNGNFTYIYQYKDHVGNVRLSYKQKPNGLLEVVKANDYYPFGMRHEKDEVVVSSNVAEKRMYNGMEFQDELQINWYDYMARNYDPAIGRWFNIDPLAEKSRRFSPYVYALNNPVYFVDPDGMEATPSEVDMVDLNANLEINAKPEDKGDGWIRQVSEGKSTYTYDASINTIDQARKAGYTGAINVLESATIIAENGEYGFDLAENGLVQNIDTKQYVNLEGGVTTEGGTTIKNSGSDEAVKSSVLEPSIMKGVEVVGNSVATAELVKDSKIGDMMRGGRAASEGLKTTLTWGGRALGATAILGTGSEWLNGNISGTEALVDTFFGVVGFIGPVGSGISLAYSLSKATYEYTTGETLFDKPIKK